MSTSALPAPTLTGVSDHPTPARAERTPGRSRHDQHPDTSGGREATSALPLVAELTPALFSVAVAVLFGGQYVQGLEAGNGAAPAICRPRRSSAGTAGRSRTACRHIGGASLIGTTPSWCRLSGGVSLGVTSRRRGEHFVSKI